MTPIDRLQGDKNCFYGSLHLLAVENRLLRLTTSVFQHIHPILVSVTSGFENRFGKFLLLEASKHDAILAAMSNPKFKLK